MNDENKSTNTIEPEQPEVEAISEDSVANNESAQTVSDVPTTSAYTPTPTTVPIVNGKLKNCSSCGNSMAKNAKHCPNCGAKNKKPFYKRVYFYVLILIVIYALDSLLVGMQRPENVVAADKLIAAIGKVDLQSEDKIRAAEKAVAALTDEEAEQLHKKETLEKAKAKYADELIDAIGKVDQKSEDKILAAEKAVAALTDEEAERLRKEKTLEKARAAYNELVLEDEVKNVQNVISAIGTVNLTSGKKIKTAREAYDKSSAEAKKQINNYDVLQKAETEFSALNVDKVVALINEIGTVTLKSGDKIEAANEAYNELTDEDKDKVTNYKTLTAAQDELKKLQKADKDAKIKKALTKLKKKYDKVEGITWYSASTDPYYADTRSYVLPYIGRRDNGSSWLRVEMHYTGDDWVFFNHVIVIVDGTRYDKYFSYNDIYRDNDTEVWEQADYLAYASDIEMLRTISKSKETIVRFEGDDHRKDITISAADKKAIAEVLDTYELLNN